MRVLIAGAGYVGTALGLVLAARGDDVWALRRDPRDLPSSLRPVGADLADPASMASLPPAVDAVAFTAAPDERTDAAYERTYVRGLATLLQALHSKQGSDPRILFTSSTAVYAQQDGEWVDERSPAEPFRFAGRRQLEAERILRDHAARPVVVRAAGIYGPGRTRLLERVRAGAATYDAASSRFTNRIHRDDLVAALVHLIDRDSPEPLYLAVDDEPAEERVVLEWLAQRLGAPPPRAEAPLRAAEGNKRCRNTRLRRSGWRPRYPTFREGYAAMLGSDPEAPGRSG